MSRPLSPRRPLSGAPPSRLPITRLPAAQGTGDGGEEEAAHRAPGNAVLVGGLALADVTHGRVDVRDVERGRGGERAQGDAVAAGDHQAVAVQPERLDGPREKRQEAP